MVSSSNPIVRTQYPRHLLVTQNLPVDTYRTLTLDKPIANATLCLCGMLTHMWIWSGIRCPSTSLIPRCRHTSLITYPTCFFTLPYSFLFRYFGRMTIWYLYSHRTWDRLRHSCIGSSPCPFTGLSGGKSLFYSGSLEPTRVLHKRGRL